MLIAALVLAAPWARDTVEPSPSPLPLPGAAVPIAPSELPSCRGWCGRRNTRPLTCGVLWFQNTPYSGGQTIKKYLNATAAKYDWVLADLFEKNLFLDPHERGSKSDGVESEATTAVPTSASARS